MTTLAQVLESPELSALFWPALEGLVRTMAESRVRTALLLDHVAKAAGIAVTKDETLNAINEEARANPGKEKVVFEYYRNDPKAAARMSMEILADRAIEHILSKAQIVDRPVSRDEFLFTCACEGLVHEQPKKSKTQG